MTKPAPNTIFETEVCGRCGGTGNYSYNQVDGTRCFGCGGCGWRRTKRGSAAYVWWKENFGKVKATEVRVGMRINTGSSKFTVVTISEPFIGGYSIVDGVRKDITLITFESAVKPGFGTFGYSTSADAMVDVIMNPEDHAASLEAAKAYQATLTVAGTPRKRG